MSYGLCQVQGEGLFFPWAHPKCLFLLMTKSLALFGNTRNTLSLALENTINLKQLGYSDVFPLRSMIHMVGKLLATVPRLSAWSPHPFPTLMNCNAEAHIQDAEGPGGQFCGEQLKDLNFLAWRRECSGRSWMLSQWAVSTGKVYFGITQRKNRCREVARRHIALASERTFNK